MRQKLTSKLLFPVVLALPFVTLLCGGDSPPTTGTTIFREDIMPNGIRWGVWGAEGYVEGEAFCSDIEDSWYDPYIVDGPIVYHSGGGSPLNPGLQYTLRCPFHHAFILDGGIWSWD